jgi:hypothetical protein
VVGSVSFRGNFEFFFLVGVCFAGERATGCVRGGRRCREGRAGDPVGQDALREGSVPNHEDDELQELSEPQLRPGGCFAGTEQLTVYFFSPNSADTSCS